MIESIKAKLWEVLKEKEVSLAMLFDRGGRILWHRGREIKGKTVHEGQGFSRSYIKQTLLNKEALETENVIISSLSEGLPESAFNLKVKCLLIQPVCDQFFLYVDSGSRESFSTADRELFKFLGKFLEDIVEGIKRDAVGTGDVAGRSSKMNRVMELVLKYSIEEEPVLLLGETGSGKNYIAGLIHKYSGRKGRFFTVNTPSIPDTLFESEIFGHRKGAFTDARADKQGYVEAARGGTLFFDEISEVPMAFQARLLRFIETRKYMVLGDPVEKEAEVRIVAATNKDLTQAIQAGEFREDLYFRLSVLELHLPPLRERKEDIEGIVMSHLGLLKDKEILPCFWEAVREYDWPGNVRELITVLTRAGIMLDGPVSGKGIREIISKSSYKPSPGNGFSRIDRAWERIRSGGSFWDVVKTPFLDRELNRDEVKEILRRGLSQSGGKYKDLLQVFNLEAGEYKRFMKFLNGNRLSL